MNQFRSAYMYHTADFPPCHDCCFPPPYPPPLVSPPDGAVGVSPSGPLEWEGQWPPVNHRVQVSEESTFSTVILDTSGIVLSSLEPEGLLNGATYYWRVNGENGWGISDWSEIWSFTTVVTGVDDHDSGIPATFFLYQNHPNPFNPVTTIRYALPEGVEVDMRVLDLLGKEVAILVSGHQDAGIHSVQWDATGYPSGVYFYRLEAGDFGETKKLVLVR